MELTEDMVYMARAGCGCVRLIVTTDKAFASVIATAIKQGLTVDRVPERFMRDEACTTSCDQCRKPRQAGMEF